jgi:hypothetical protein
MVILGCVTPALVLTPPPSEPGSFETVVAQTANAAQMQTATALPPSGTASLIPSPTKTLTITPSSTATVLFLIATNTPLPTGLFADGTRTASGDNGDGDGFVKPTATPSEWACRVLSRYPPRGATVVAGRNLTAVWTVQNTGTKTWPKQGVDVVYESGAQLNYGRPYYDIPAGTGPGSIVRISVVMEIPKRPKEYNMRWSLKVGRTNFCSVQFAFEAK